jgi:hypothetical protein
VSGPSTVDKRTQASPQQLAHLNGEIEGGRDRVWRQWMLVGVGLVGLLATVAIIGAFVALGSDTPTTTIVREAPPASGPAASTAGSSAQRAASLSSVSLGSGTAQMGAASIVPIVLQKDGTTGTTGTITGRDGWPRFAPSNLTVPAGKKVTLVITNYDDMNTPLSAGEPITV